MKLIAKIIAFLNLKGGCGKTTVAHEVSAAAHLDGFQVGVADCDAQASLYRIMAQRSDKSQLKGLVTVKSDRPLSYDKVAAFAAGFDLLLLDGPPRLDAMSRSLATAADLVVVPLRAGEVELWAIEDTLAMLAEADANRQSINRPPSRKLFVLNQVKPDTRIALSTSAAIAEGGGRIANQVIAFRVTYPVVAGRGESVLTAGRDRAARAEIMGLYRECRRELNLTKPKHPRGRA